MRLRRAAILVLLGLTSVAFAADPAWNPAAALAVQRWGSVGIVLDDGSVLVLGGGAGAWATGAQRFLPGTGAWTTAGTMVYDQLDAKTVKLLDGRVLAGASAQGDLGKCEIYDPATATWSAAADLPDVRRDCAFAVLPSGKVLMAGGYDVVSSSVVPQNSCYLYDPATNTWAPTGSVTTARTSQALTRLADGRVLMSGGHAGTSALGGCELYDPAAGTWSSTGAMPAPRMYHQTAVLPDGTVLAIGGDDLTGTPPKSCARYNPTLGTWSGAGTLAASRSNGFSLAVMADGRVVIAGGGPTMGASNGTATCEYYNPLTNAWYAAPTLGVDRRYAAAAPLPSGGMLMAGGISGTSSSLTDLDSAEILSGAAPVLTAPTTKLGSVGLALSLAVTSTNHVDAYLGSNLPPGLGADPATGAVSGTPTTIGAFATATVTACNAMGSGSATTVYTILAANALTPVVDASAAPDQVPEDAAPGTSAGIVANAVDPSGASPAYALSDSAGGRFAIDATTGAVTVAGPLDFETAASHSITVTATSGPRSGSATFVIAVTDVAEPPAGGTTAGTTAGATAGYRPETGGSTCGLGGGVAMLGMLAAALARRRRGDLG
jgi:hypothetical protein